MDPLSVAGWGLVYAGIGSLVARVVYQYLQTAHSHDGDECLAFWAMLLWPVVVTTGVIWVILTLLAPFGCVLGSSWEWWLRD